MTSTPVSLNDESLNGSWIDINSASQIHSPIDDDSPERLRPPYSMAESVQSLGLLSFQVERFLQEAQKSTNQNGASNNNISIINNNQNGQQQQQYPNVDNISDICFSDSDMSADCIQGSKPMLDSLREHYNTSRSRHQYQQSSNTNEQLSAGMKQRISSRSGDCLVDQLSDSLSLLSRASLFGETGMLSSNNGLDQTNNFQDFDWLWDWTAQPEYFTGQEWKVSPPKQEFVKQRQSYTGVGQHGGKIFSGDIMSLLFLTNILSIIIGAGITYSILMRRSSI